MLPVPLLEDEDRIPPVDVRVVEEADEARRPPTPAKGLHIVSRAKLERVYVYDWWDEVGM